MPTSPTAISNFLQYVPPAPPLAFGEVSRAVLIDEIEASGDHELLTRTDPYKHQLAGLAFALWAERSLLRYEMRTGKTKIALDWIAYLIYSGQLRKKALVIAHAPIGAETWEGQNSIHSHLHIVVVKSGPQAIDQFVEALVDADCDAIIVAWSTLQQLFGVKRRIPSGSKKGGEKLYADRDLLRYVAPHFDAVVIDEIHMAGHDHTLRFAIASELVARCRWRLGLTGTPFGRDPLLLWAQAFLIDGGVALGRNYRFFREAFCTARYNPFMRGTDYVFDAKKMPLLRDKMRAMSLHCELRDVQEVNVLPGVVRLKMSEEQAKAYDEAIERLVQLKSGNAIEVDSVFVRLRQIASGFLPFEDTAGEERVVEFPDAAKLVWLDDFIEYLPDDMQIVIFHEFIRSGRMICDILDKHSVAYDWLRGGTRDRAELLQRFRSGETRVLVANVATGGMAIDLSSADYLLFFESPASVITRRQAEARPLARGSRPLVVDDLVCAPVERKLLDFLHQGNNLREALVRNPKLADELRR